ncbi:MAG: hypothetical protein MJ227_00020 [Bacilli bacterium]|nr:hypothetical protein [Bacilli bacterium]
MEKNKSKFKKTIIFLFVGSIILALVLLCNPLQYIFPNEKSANIFNLSIVFTVVALSIMGFVSLVIGSKESKFLKFAWIFILIATLLNIGCGLCRYFGSTLNNDVLSKIGTYTDIAVVLSAIVSIICVIEAINIKYVEQDKQQYIKFNMFTEKFYIVVIIISSLFSILSQRLPYLGFQADNISLLIFVILDEILSATCYLLVVICFGKGAKHLE